MIPDGLIVRESRHDPQETAERLLAAVTAHGMKVMARVDHAAAAATVGLSLRPTEVLMFGNPKGGTPLMQAVQTIGIDLPLKVLVWQDEAGKTWVGYNDPHWIATRHGAAIDGDAAIGAMTRALAAVAQAAADSDDA
jgi:uncharacterized protein (DUF302 family)